MTEMFSHLAKIGCAVTFQDILGRPAGLGIREEFMAMRMRVAVRPMANRVEELRIAGHVRQELWAHSPVEVDPDHPLHGTHRDNNGRAYFEFVTTMPDEVRRVLNARGFADRVDLIETPSIPGEECANCGNVSGPVLPSVCPNCDFRDISPCPACQREVPRSQYMKISNNLFRCPRCQNQVLLRFNEPMFLSDGRYNQPIVVVEEAAVADAVR
jgi:hypothetical protein